MPIFCWRFALKWAIFGLKTAQNAYFWLAFALKWTIFGLEEIGNEAYF